MIFKIFIVSIFLTYSFTNGSYEGYKVVEMNLKTDEEIKIVLKLVEKFQADVWKGPSKVISTHVMLSPQTLKGFIEELKNADIAYKVVIENVQENIDREALYNMKANSSTFRTSVGPVVTNHFATLEEIMEWIDYLTRRHSFVSSGVYGRSYEGRSLRYVKISTGPNRKAVLLDGGIHAREWLAVSTVTYSLEKMIYDYIQGKSEIVALLSKFDFYFIPVFNPDGYAFTHTQGNRLWRKSRRPMKYLGITCYGVDLNRNFDADFGGTGTSSYPCDDIYRGPSPFSEPETKHFSTFVANLQNSLKLYISLHTYAQFWFVPYAYTRKVASDDVEMRRVANIGNQALYNKNGIYFVVGTPPELLYAASGGAYDWVKLKLGIKYAYTLELRPSRSSTQGLNGFIAPVSDIRGSGEEVYSALVATAQSIVI